MGTFVPQSRCLSKGFSAVDSTKGSVAVGILPSDLFFVGTERTITVKEAGTLFLGINDCCASGNEGAFTVSVTFVPST